MRSLDLDIGHLGSGDTPLRPPGHTVICITAFILIPA